MCQHDTRELDRKLTIAEINKKWEAHKSGEAPLSDKEAKELAVEKFMLSEH